MDARLEATVSQALYAVRLVERALHSHGSWTIRVEDVSVPAERVFSESGVVFQATFPEHQWSGQPATLTLVEDGVDVMVREVEPSDTGFEVNWGLALLVPVA